MIKNKRNFRLRSLSLKLFLFDEAEKEFVSLWPQQNLSHDMHDINTISFLFAKTNPALIFIQNCYRLLEYYQSCKISLHVNHRLQVAKFIFPFKIPGSDEFGAPLRLSDQNLPLVFCFNLHKQKEKIINKTFNAINVQE